MRFPPRAGATRTSQVGNGPRAGFSLSELLVVIAIIAVVASMTLPTLSLVRDTAKSARCQGNLRQIGLAFLAYTNDNEDALPRGWNDGTSAVDVTWDDLLGSAYDGRDLPQSSGPLTMNQKYLAVAGTAAKNGLYDLYRCPADELGKQGPFIAGQPAAGFWKRDYAVTGWGTAAPSAADTKGLMSSCTSVGIAGTDWAARLGEIHRPAEKILLAEILNEYAALGKGVGAGPTCCSPDKQLNSGSGVPDSYYGQPGRPFHRGKWNYLFVDGHVATLLGSETRSSSDYHFPGGMWDRDN